MRWTKKRTWRGILAAAVVTLMCGGIPAQAAAPGISAETEVLPEEKAVSEVVVSPEPSTAPEPSVTPDPSEPGEAPEPEVKQGLLYEDGSYHYYIDGELLKGSWKKINGRRYYFKKNGDAAIGSHKVKGQFYVFNGKGQRLQPKKTKIVTIASGMYYVDPKGRPQPGWQVIKNQLYSVKKNGLLRTDCTYQDVTFRKNGQAVSSTWVNLKIKTMSILAGITTPKMTNSQKLRACWSYVVSGRFYYAGKYPNLNVAGWQRSTALDMLTTHCGNCYSFACAFAALAKEVGYSPVVICGRVPGSRDGAGDGMTRHAWVMINGRHFDPEGQYAGWCPGVYNSGGYPFGHSIQKTVRF